MPGNRTQLFSISEDIGFEGREEHQLLNHSQFLTLWSVKNSKVNS